MAKQQAVGRIKLNKGLIRAKYIHMPEDVFDSLGSDRKRAEYLGIPKTTLHDYLQERDSEGLTWDQKRLAHYKAVEDKVSEDITKKRARLIAKTSQDYEDLLSGLIVHLKSALNDPKLDITDANTLVKFLDAFKKLAEANTNLNKVGGAQRTGGGNQIAFNINLPVHLLSEKGKKMHMVPDKYLNAAGIEWKRSLEFDIAKNLSPKGRDWLSSQIEDPESIEDAEFEVEDDGVKELDFKF